MSPAEFERWFIADAARAAQTAAPAAAAPADGIAPRAEVWPLFLDALESGAVAATERDADGNWQAVAWVKAAILSGFKSGGIESHDWPGGAFDRPAFPPRRFAESDGVRVVPGGSSAARTARQPRPGRPGRSGRPRRPGRPGRPGRPQCYVVMWSTTGADLGTEPWWTRLHPMWT